MTDSSLNFNIALLNLFERFANLYLWLVYVKTLFTSLYWWDTFFNQIYKLSSRPLGIKLHSTTSYYNYDILYIFLGPWMLFGGNGYLCYLLSKGGQLRHCRDLSKEKMIMVVREMTKWHSGTDRKDKNNTFLSWILQYHLEEEQKGSSLLLLKQVNNKFNDLVIK